METMRPSKLVMPFVATVLFCACVSTQSCARLQAQDLAKPTEIEKLVEPVAEEVSRQLGQKKVVVACRWIGSNPIYWQPQEAVATELTAALRKRKIDAIRYATDHRIVALGSKKVAFTKKDADKIRAVNRDLLLAVELVEGSEPKLILRILNAENGDEAIWQKTILVPVKTLEMSANIPELNKLIVGYCEKSKGKCVGQGICSTLAKFALKEAKANQPGVYTWGRELDEREPILPGDILQFELVKLRGPKFSKNYTHHTAVVTDVTKTHIVVHHQNVGKLGKVVQREELPLNAKRTGIIQAYRPWHGKSSLPSLSPRRRTPPSIVRRGNSIDLLATLNPRLDSVHGIWFRDDNGLKWNRDTFARLQVPVNPPGKYVLKMKVERLFGSDALGIGVVVGGRQVQVVVDGYKSKISGLNLLDGKKCNANDTTFRGAVIPNDKIVRLEVHVTKTSVKLIADRKTIIDWKGDAKRLSMQRQYQVPNKDWLFLTSYNTQFHITEFLLEK